MKLVEEAPDLGDKIHTDEEDDELSEMTPRTKARMMNKTGKKAVSAEVYGKNNPKGNFKPKVASV